MANKPVGRQVQVRSKFTSAAVVPGGVDRRGATQAADLTVADMQAQVQRQVADSLEPLLAQLRAWDGVTTRLAMQGVCEQAAATRDLAGLVNQHLLTEVAMYTFDCLDVVLIDGARLDAREAACFADALDFARGDLCLGSDLTAYGPLLKDLATLTALVVARASLAMPSIQASCISSLISVAPTSSAPRKMNGKHSTLLTWFG